MERVEMVTQIDGVFLCGEESSRFTLLFELEQFANVSFTVCVMVAVKGFGCGFDVGRAQLLNETLGPGDSAEDDRAGRNMLGLNSSVHAPYQLVLQREAFGRGIAGQSNRIGAAQGTQGFAQAAGG